MTDVDLDRLADYVCGALDGAPDGAAVARLIDTNQRWSAAYAELLAADEAVRADLATLAAMPDAAMPDDVVTRLTSALAGARAPAATAVSIRPARPTRPAPRTVRPQSRRRRWALALAAAATVAVVGLGAVAAIPILGGSGLYRSWQADKSTAERAPEDLSGASPPDGEPILLSTGTNYQPGDFGAADALGENNAAPDGAARPSVSGGQPADTDGGPRGIERSGAVPTPAELARLTRPEALGTCLTSVTAKHGGIVTVVDYARFRGTAALVVFLSGDSSTPDRRWVVVVGAQCGVDGTSDELYNGPTA